MMRQSGRGKEVNCCDKNTNQIQIIDNQIVSIQYSSSP